MSLSAAVNRTLSLEVVWTDPYTVKVRGRLDYDTWTGVSSTYTASSDINQLESSLSQFNDGIIGDVSFQAGEADGTGMIALRFYRYDSAGHIACHVRLATMTATEHRPEEIFTLTVEVKTETSLIDKFIKGLQKMAADQSGSATLELV